MSFDGSLQFVLWAILTGALAVAALVGLVLVRRLRHSERRYSVLVEQLPQMAIAVFDRELRFELLAGPAVRAAGLSREDVEGKRLEELLPGAEPLSVHFRAALRGESRSFELRSPLDGRDYWVRVLPAGGRPGRRGLAVALDVTDRKRAERELRDHAADVDAVAEVSRALARSTEPGAARRAVCEGARQVAGAPVAVLFEPAADGSSLIASAVAGADADNLIVPFAGGESGAVRAFTSREPFFAAEAGEDRFSRQVGAVSTLWHPVMQERAAVGVLGIAWPQRVERVPLRLTSVMDLLAAEAAVAIGRADLLSRLERLALTDELTGLPNRRAWEDHVPRELARAWREEQPVCIAMLDLDLFKKYNDEHGHLAGDRLLKQAAASWRTALRATDLLARYGGEEFSVVLPACGIDDAIALVERLRSVTPEGQTCSAGLAEWDRAEHAESLVERADRALYEAKREGRNRTVVAAHSA